MREKRFFVNRTDIKGKTALLSREESHHLKDVLHIKKGEPVIVFNGEGQEFDGKVATLTGRVGVVIEKKRRSRPSDPVSVCLAQALPKKKRMDFIIAKACELGVSEIYPLEAERSSFKLKGPVVERVLNRWQRIALETCKQAHLDWIPKLHEPVSLKDLLQKNRGFEAIIIPHPDPDLPKLSDVVAPIKSRIRQVSDAGRSPAGVRRVLIVIGPEGGFSERELALCKERGAHRVNLGDLVLRTETASVVAVALVKYAFNL